MFSMRKILNRKVIDMEKEQDFLIIEALTSLNLRLKNMLKYFGEKIVIFELDPQMDVFTQVCVIRLRVFSPRFWHWVFKQVV